MKMIRLAALLTFCLAIPSVYAQPALLNVDPVLLDFGTLDVGDSAQLEMKLTNLTSAPLNITGFTASGSGNFTIDVNGGAQACGSQNPALAPNGFCTMVVDYMPASEGSFSGSVSFTPNGQADSSINARFLGESVDPNNGGGCSLGGGSAAAMGGVAAFLPVLLSWVYRRHRES